MIYTALAFTFVGYETSPSFIAIAKVIWVRHFHPIKQKWDLHWTSVPIVSARLRPTYTTSRLDRIYHPLPPPYTGTHLQCIYSAPSVLNKPSLYCYLLSSVLHLPQSKT
jgi:hypothetical protein